MMTPIIMALLGGVLIGLSRQLNGRLALSTSAMMASFWNHFIGLLFLSVLGIAGGFAFWREFESLPAWVWLGGPTGVVFIAAGSWLIVRIGATATALMVIAGQVIGGVALDLLQGATRNPLLDVLGIAMIMAGISLAVLKRTEA